MEGNISNYYMIIPSITTDLNLHYDTHLKFYLVYIISLTNCIKYLYQVRRISSHECVLGLSFLPLFLRVDNILEFGQCVNFWFLFFLLLKPNMFR